MESSGSQAGQRGCLRGCNEEEENEEDLGERERGGECSSSGERLGSFASTKGGGEREGRMLESPLFVLTMKCERTRGRAT